MNAGLTPPQVASARIFLAAVILLVGTLLLRPNALKLPRRDLPVLLAYGVVGVAAVQLLYFVAVSRLPVGVAMLLEYLSRCWSHSGAIRAAHPVTQSRLVRRGTGAGGARPGCRGLAGCRAQHPRCAGGTRHGDL